MTAKVFIDGGAGTTGIDIVDRLTGRPEIDVVILPEDRRKDPAARADALNAADAVILCLPDDAAREAVSLIKNDHTKVIDASTAHRVAEGWVYGFAELEPNQRSLLANGGRVSNPGCYPTGFLALVRPLVRDGIIGPDLPMSVNAVSGYSGGGKAMIAAFEQAGDGATDAAYRIYGLDLAHKHAPEMQQHAGLIHAPLFMPAVARRYSGMIVEVPLHTSQLNGSVAQIRASLNDAYAGEPLIRVVDEARSIVTIEECANTDRLSIFVFANEQAGQVRLVAALDNLGKGAGGAAVQNLNIALGLPETSGLRI